MLLRIGTHGGLLFMYLNGRLIYLYKWETYLLTYLFKWRTVIYLNSRIIYLFVYIIGGLLLMYYLNRELLFTYVFN